MRTLSSELAAAAATLGSQPEITLELADVQPHFATVPVSGPDGPVAAAIAADGALVVATISAGTPNHVTVLRVTAPGDAASWAPPTAVSSDGRAQAGIALCVSGSTVRVLWQASSTTQVLHADSSDNGQTWGAPAALFDPGYPCYGLAASDDLNTLITAYDHGGLGSQRHARMATVGVSAISRYSAAQTLAKSAASVAYVWGARLPSRTCRLSAL